MIFIVSDTEFIEVNFTFHIDAFAESIRDLADSVSKAAKSIRKLRSVFIRYQEIKVLKWKSWTLGLTYNEQCRLNMAMLPGKKRLPWEGKHVERTKHKRRHPNQKLYNGMRWRNFRKEYIFENPLCAFNEFIGRVASGQIVDHIIPVNEGGAKFDKRNMMTLTKAVHDTKSGFEGHHGILVPWIEVETGKIPKDKKDILIYLQNNMKNGTTFTD